MSVAYAPRLFHIARSQNATCDQHSSRLAGTTPCSKGCRMARREKRRQSPCVGADRDLRHVATCENTSHAPIPSTRRVTGHRQLFFRGMTHPAGADEPQKETWTATCKPLWTARSPAKRCGQALVDSSGCMRGGILPQTTDRRPCPTGSPHCRKGRLYWNFVFSPRRLATPIQTHSSHGLRYATTRPPAKVCRPRSCERCQTPQRPPAVSSLRRTEEINRRRHNERDRQSSIGRTAWPP